MASLVHHEREVESMTVTVPAIRLDEEESLAGDGRIVAWIDVEGANEAVLSSGPKVLRRVDVLYLEVEDGITWEGVRRTGRRPAGRPRGGPAPALPQAAGAAVRGRDLSPPQAGPSRRLSNLAPATVR